jgi:glucokinase
MARAGAAKRNGEGRSPSGGGVPRVLVGADVGATTIAAGLVTESGELVTFERVATHGRGRGTALAVLLEVIEALLRAAERDGLSTGGIGIGLPGIVDADQGMMVSDKNYVPEFADVPLASNLRTSTALPVFVDNDANALALGELEFGVGRGAASMVLLAIGTGVGGAIVSGGELVRGHSGCAGEFGHMSIDFLGEASSCPCGLRGCLNSYLAGEALARTGREAVARGESSKLLTLAGGDPQQIRAALVFEAAAAGDGVATAIVERACTALAAAIGGIVTSLDPGVAGSLFSHERHVLDLARQYALPRALAGTRVRIVAADKRRMVLGGAALALHGLRKAGRPVGSGSPTGSDRDTTGRR